jgi:hypothetical protein
VVNPDDCFSRLENRLLVALFHLARAEGERWRPGGESEVDTAGGPGPARKDFLGAAGKN